MVTQIFDHVTIGDGFEALKSIQDPAVNLSIARGVVDAETKEYLNAIDWHAHFKSDWDAEPTSRIGCTKNCGACSMADASDSRVFILPAKFKTHDPREEDTAEIVSTGLERFPSASGLNFFANTIKRAITTFAVVTGASKVESFVMVKHTAGRATWHRDNGTDQRGLITFLGPGTYWRPNDSVPVEDWNQNFRDERGRPVNSFGQFGKTFMDSANQVETGTMVILKGGLHHRPIIHAEPTYDVTGDRRALRVVLHMDMA